MTALIWFVFLYGVERRTIKISDTNRIRSFEMWCWRRILDVLWKEHLTDESVLLELQLKRNLKPRSAQLKLQYSGHVGRGSAGELALMLMEGPWKEPGRGVLQGNSGWITFRNGAVKPTRNAGCWHKLGTVGERCPGSGRYLSRTHIRGTYLKKKSLIIKLLRLQVSFTKQWNFE